MIAGKLNWLLRETRRHESARDLAIVELLAQTGLRAGEGAALVGHQSVATTVRYTQPNRLHHEQLTEWLSRRGEREQRYQVVRAGGREESGLATRIVRERRGAGGASSSWRRTG